MTTQRGSAEQTLASAKSIERFVGELFDTAISRDLYGIALDDQYRVLDPLFCVEDYPQVPGYWYRTGKNGWAKAGQVLFEAWRTACATLGGCEFVIIWERPGSAELTPRDMEWASTMFDLARSPGPTLRAQVLVHSAGVRLIRPDDLAVLQQVPDLEPWD